MFNPKNLLLIFLIVSGALGASDLKDDDSNFYCGCHRKLNREIQTRYFSEAQKNANETLCCFPACIKIRSVEGPELLGCEAKFCCGLVAKNTSYHVPSSFCRCSIFTCLSCSMGDNETERFGGLGCFGAGLVASLKKGLLSCFSACQPSCCCTSDQCCDVMGLCCKGLGLCCTGICECLGCWLEICEKMDCDDCDDCGDLDFGGGN